MQSKNGQAQLSIQDSTPFCILQHKTWHTHLLGDGWLLLFENLLVFDDRVGGSDNIGDVAPKYTISTCSNDKYPYTALQPETEHWLE